MLANWPLLLIRIIESIVMIIIVIVAIVAVIVPLVVSVSGKTFPTVNDPGDVLPQVLAILSENLVLILYIQGIVLVVVTVWLAVHSFVSAGAVRIYVDSMQRTAALPIATRDQLNAYTTERWLEGGRMRWWSVFWIYNIAWGVAALILLVPLIALIALMIAFRANGPAAAITGCAGIFLLLIIMIPAAILTGIWTQKAIVDCVARGSGAMDSLRMSWREFKADFGRHLAVAAIMFVVSFGAAIAVSSMSSMASFGHPPGLWMVPLQFSSSIVNSIVGAAVGAWFLACFSALAVEPA